MSIDYERVGKRLADARRRRTTAIEAEDDAKAARRQADGEIEECLREIETGEPQRPLLDAIERNGVDETDDAATVAEKPGPRGEADYFGKRQRAKKAKAKQ